MPATFKLTDIIASELRIPRQSAENTAKLLSESCTVPFISRYRKEATGGLDEMQIAAIDSRLKELNELLKRKETILKTIAEQNLLSPELQQKIENCFQPNELEDLYLPYKPKRKTKASVAKEKGLEPLAAAILAQKPGDIELEAEKYLTDMVAGTCEAIAGAKDIIAEIINEDAQARAAARQVFARTARVEAKVAKGKEAEGDKYKDYFSFSEKLDTCPSHRVLAVMRAETEGILKLSIEPDNEAAESSVSRLFVKGRHQSSELVAQAAADSYKRLMKPSIEKEFYNAAKEKADREAIRIFADNLRQLLLAAPVGEKRTLAIDPGFRTGCKVTCLSEHGDLLTNDTIYPHEPQKQEAKAADTIKQLVKKYSVEVIAVGNGTAGRETEAFIKSLGLGSVKLYLVSESGASIYSASKLARDEFPSHDVTVRGAVSIGRRLMDPLAELVKIDPKSIGVGQYQHDVDQAMLSDSLTSVVESCVNSVGVDINTASKHLLAYVSGLGPVLADNIVKHRQENGKFMDRKQLLKVPRMGPKAYQQCAGFLRIRNGKNPLDASAVHPEAYGVVEKMAKDKGVKLPQLLADKSLRQSVKIEQYVSNEIGLPTLKDIMAELEKPGRDPRQAAGEFEFDQTVTEISQLREGMVLPGIVTNLTNFGAFVDIGLKENGLLHISAIADRFIQSPSEVLKLSQQVRVEVVSVDTDRKRIQLSMKSVPQK
jgi:protein Tex